MSAAPAAVTPIEPDLIHLTANLADKVQHLTTVAKRNGWRKVLNRIRIADGHMWVTDSYIVLRVPLPDGLDLPDVSIPADALRAALRACTKKAETTIRVTEDTTTVTSVRTDLTGRLAQTFEIEHDTDEEDFPNVVKFWPDDDEIAEALERGDPSPHINPRFVADMQAMAGDGMGLRLVNVRGDREPQVVVDIDWQPVGVVMPMRETTPRPEVSA